MATGIYIYIYTDKAADADRMLAEGGGTHFELTWNSHGTH